MKFYVNKKTGAFVTACCECVNDPSLVLLKENDTDAATEKHVPVVSVEGNKVSVCVGSVLHPMTDEHLISTIILETSCGYQLRKLTSADQPKAVFALSDGEKPIAVYEYCNLHGLWVSKL